MNRVGRQVPCVTRAAVEGTTDASSSEAVSCLRPSSLNTPFISFRLETDIHLGGRYDHNADRHFLGRMALLDIFSFDSDAGMLTDGQVGCVFEDGDLQLPQVMGKPRLR